MEEMIRAAEENGRLPGSAGQFKDIAEGMLRTYVRKNHDYGNSFDKSLDKFGLVASAVRIGDKMNRIESLVRKEAMVQDESIRDTAAKSSK